MLEARREFERHADAEYSVLFDRGFRMWLFRCQA
jgi:hypothetical protein